MGADKEAGEEDLLRARSMLGHILNLTGGIDEARSVTERAIEQARASPSWQLPELLDRASLLAAKDGRDEDALRYLHEAYEVARQLGDTSMVLLASPGLPSSDGGISGNCP